MFEISFNIFQLLPRGLPHVRERLFFGANDGQESFSGFAPVGSGLGDNSHERRMKTIDDFKTSGFYPGKGG